MDIPPVHEAAVGPVRGVDDEAIRPAVAQFEIPTTSVNDIIASYAPGAVEAWADTVHVEDADGAGLVEDVDDDGDGGEGEHGDERQHRHADGAAGHLVFSALLLVRVDRVRAWSRVLGLRYQWH